MDVPAPDLRSNIGTWAVPNHALPALANRMVHALPTEEFDPNFQGQYLETTYFDTRDFTLFKARRSKDKYLTLRIRCYSPPYDPGSPRQKNAEVYALSAKTKQEKFRILLATEDAEAALEGAYANIWQDTLPGSLLARLIDLVNSDPLLAIVTICARRYAVENKTDRITLDCDITTNNGKTYPSNVVEYKSTAKDKQPPIVMPGTPIKLSKFLWSLM
jgi:hypothetical protein